MIPAVDKAFKGLIFKTAIHNELNITSGLVRKYRYNLKNNIPISTDAKLEILRKSGWRMDKQYSRSDLVSLLNFWKRTSQTARDHGPEYVIEKWEAGK